MKLNLCENIRKYRKRIDWTQEQLADRLGVSYQSVSRWESGNGYPDMEHLPTMARLFSVTMDDLIGYGDENEKLSNREMKEKFRQTLAGGDVDEIVSLMRLLRYEYLEEFDQIYFSLTSLRPGKLTESPKFMEELRLLIGEYLKHGRLQAAKISMINTMIGLEDDEHFEHLLEEHHIDGPYDLSVHGILMSRAIAKEDDAEYRITRAIQKMTDLFEYFDRGNPFFYKEWDPAWKGVIPPEVEDDLPDVPELDPFVCADRSRRKLRMLHDINLVDPNEAHPVSGDGTLDMWFTVRLDIGLFYAAQLSACGEYDPALTVLEDCASLIEQAYDFPGGAEQYRNGYYADKLPQMTCRSPEFAGISVHRAPLLHWNTETIVAIAVHFDRSCDFNHIYRKSYSIPLGYSQNWYCRCLTKQQIPREGFRSSWFDPIRSHPRYLAVVERIRKTEKSSSDT